MQIEERSQIGTWEPSIIVLVVCFRLFNFILDKNFPLKFFSYFWYTCNASVTRLILIISLLLTTDCRHISISLIIIFWFMKTSKLSYFFPNVTIFNQQSEVPFCYPYQHLAHSTIIHLTKHSVLTNFWQDEKSTKISHVIL